VLKPRIFSVVNSNYRLKCWHFTRTASTTTSRVCSSMEFDYPYCVPYNVWQQTKLLQ